MNEKRLYEDNVRINEGVRFMSGFYTEADYENSIIELFQNMDTGMSTRQI